MLAPSCFEVVPFVKINLVRSVSFDGSWLRLLVVLQLDLNVIWKLLSDTHHVDADSARYVDLRGTDGLCNEGDGGRKRIDWSGSGLILHLCIT